MTLACWTARLGFRGDDWLDVSLQGNTRRADAGEIGGHRGMGLLFAPSPNLLYPYLSKRRFGKLTRSDWPRYRDAYTDEMRASYRTYRPAWDELLALESVTLLCFCVAETSGPDAGELHCHRVVLGQILTKLGATYLGERATVREEKTP